MVQSLLFINNGTKCTKAYNFYTMKIRNTLQITLFIVIIAALFLVPFAAQKGGQTNAVPTMELPDDVLDTMLNVSFLFPKDENPSLPSDIYSQIFEEDQSMHYFIVPHDFRADKVVCYALAEDGTYLNRYIIDFSADPEYMIGLRTLILTRTNLPVLTLGILDDSPTIEELNASDKTVECRGNLTLETDGNNIVDTVTVTGRGNVSWYSSAKKSYTLAFDHSVSIQGLGRNRKWNLVSNSLDKSLLNNEVFYKMSSDIGIDYEPSYTQVSVFINGRYNGVYLLTSKVSVDADRVALSKGDFFMNMGDPDKSNAIFLNSRIWLDDEGTVRPYVNIKWPKDNSEAERNRQERILQRAFSSLEDPDDTDYTEYFDLNSLVRYYWVQEICMNYDADYRSAYAYYKQSTDKIYFGPVWDLDIALGWNAGKFDTDFTSPTGWKLRNMSWYACLYEHEGFEDALADAYFNDGIREAMFNALNDYRSGYEALALDGRLNYRRWRSEWPDLAIRHGENYDDECLGRLDFLTQRINWIDEQMLLLHPSTSSDPL